jgi:hypothetical protein
MLEQFSNQGETLVTTQSDLDINPAIFIGIANDLDLGIDKDENLLIVKRMSWGVSDERTYLGPASHTLIDSMITGLQRMKVHAIKP